jgi:hypothetical protein
MARTINEDDLFDYEQEVGVMLLEYEFATDFKKVNPEKNGLNQAYFYGLFEEEPDL